VKARPVFRWGRTSSSAEFNMSDPKGYVLDRRG